MPAWIAFVANFMCGVIFYPTSVAAGEPKDLQCKGSWKGVQR